MFSWTKSRWWIHLFCLLCLCLADLCVCQKCPDGMNYFPPDSCVLLASGSSRDQCNFQTTDGLAVLTESQLNSSGILSQYAAAVLVGSDLMWLGYGYDGSGQLVTARGGSSSSEAVSSTVLTDDSNFNSSRSVAPGATVCVAVTSGGMFVRRSCDESVRWSLCQKSYGVPGISSTSLPSTPSANQSVTLTCSLTNTKNSVSWMFARDLSSAPVSVSSQSSYTISSFSDSLHGGLYYCVESTPVWGFIHLPIILGTSGSTQTINSVNNTAPTATYNAQLGITCTNDLSGGTLSQVRWFINGVYEVNTSDLNLDALRQAGYYQCIATGDNNVNSVGTVWIIPQSGIPSSVNVLYMEPQSSSSLEVSWFCPQYPGTYDPILLSYRVSYNNSVTGVSSTVDVRASVGMVGQDSCFVQTSVDSLNEGTPYSTSIQAVAFGNEGVQSEIRADAATFGQAPGMVQELKVFRTEDNKTVFATWTKLETTPPVGVVEEYYVEYRETEKKSASTIRKSSDQTFVYIINVVNANSYQVRVRAGVLSSNIPITYSYGPFTEWMQVGGIAPTTEKLRGRPRTTAIAAGVVVGGLVFIVIVSVFIVGVICFTVKGRDGGMSRFSKKEQPSVKKELTEVS